MTESSPEFIILNSNDNVVTARRTLKSGLDVLLSGVSVKLKQTVPGGHKVALTLVKNGQELIKYGQNIGFAKMDIEAESFASSTGRLEW